MIGAANRGVGSDCCLYGYQEVNGSADRPSCVLKDSLSHPIKNPPARDAGGSIRIDEGLLLVVVADEAARAGADAVNFLFDHVLHECRQIVVQPIAQHWA